MRPWEAPGLLSQGRLSLAASQPPRPSRHCREGRLAWAIRLVFLRTGVKRSVFPSFQECLLPTPPPPFIFANSNQTQCCPSSFAINWLLENIIFKRSPGNDSLAIRNYTKSLHFWIACVKPCRTRVCLNGRALDNHEQGSEFYP